MQTSKPNKTFFPGRKYHLGSDYSRKRSDLLKEKISKTHECKKKNLLFIPAVTLFW